MWIGFVVRNGFFRLTPSLDYYNFITFYEQLLFYHQDDSNFMNIGISNWVVDETSVFLGFFEVPRLEKHENTFVFSTDSRMKKRVFVDCLRSRGSQCTKMRVLSDCWIIFDQKNENPIMIWGFYLMIGLIINNSTLVNE